MLMDTGDLRLNLMTRIMISKVWDSRGKLTTQISRQLMMEWPPRYFFALSHTICCMRVNIESFDSCMSVNQRRETMTKQCSFVNYRVDALKLSILDIEWKNQFATKFFNY